MCRLSLLLRRPDFRFPFWTQKERNRESTTKKCTQSHTQCISAAVSYRFIFPSAAHFLCQCFLLPGTCFATATSVSYSNWCCFSSRGQVFSLLSFSFKNSSLYWKLFLLLFVNKSADFWLQQFPMIPCRDLLLIHPLHFPPTASLFFIHCNYFATAWCFKQRPSDLLSSLLRLPLLSRRPLKTSGQTACFFLLADEEKISLKEIPKTCKRIVAKGKLTKIY